MRCFLPQVQLGSIRCTLSGHLVYRQQLSQPQERAEAVKDLSAFLNQFTPETLGNAPIYRLHFFIEKHSMFAVRLLVSCRVSLSWSDEGFRLAC